MLRLISTGSVARQIFTEDGSDIIKSPLRQYDSSGPPRYSPPVPSTKRSLVPRRVSSSSHRLQCSCSSPLRLETSTATSRTSSPFPRAAAPSGQLYSLYVSALKPTPSSLANSRTVFSPGFTANRESTSFHSFLVSSLVCISAPLVMGKLAVNSLPPRFRLRCPAPS